MKPDEEVKAPRLFDVRTIERNIRKGLTTRKDYEKYLKTLPDAAEKAATAAAEEEDDDLLEDEDDLDDEDGDDDEDMTDDTTPPKDA